MASSGERMEKQRRVVLVLDEDPHAARQAGLTLQGPHCNVLCSAKYQEGLRIAARQKPDLILLETTYSGIDGLVLAEKLRQASKTASVAIAFLTADKSVVKRLKAIRLGAMDYIVKQVEGRMLAPRLKALLGRLDQPRATPLTISDGDQLQEALARIENDAASGVLLLERPGEKAHIAFEDGVARRSKVGELNGEAALNAIAARDDWRVSFAEGRKGFAGAKDTEPERSSIRTVPNNGQADPLASTDRVRGLPPGLLVRGEGASSAGHALVPERGLGEVSHDDDDIDTDRTVMDPSQRANRGDIILAGEEGAPAKGAERLDVTLPETPGTKELDEDTSRLSLDESGSYEEDLPTSMLSKGSSPRHTLSHDDLLQQVMIPAGVVDKAAPLVNETFAHWLGQPDRAPLLLVFPQERLRSSLRTAAEEVGYSVVEATTSLEAYTAALRLRPVAIISDVRGAKVDGRELLAAVRSDFAIRETPFVMVSGEYLFEQLSAAGPAAFSPILDGLVAALSPRVELEERRASGQLALHGRVGPIGTCTLLRALSAERASGRLRLQQAGLFSAEVILQQGMIVEATVRDPRSSSGAMALLNLTGYEWQEYSFSEEINIDSQPALGETGQLLSTACQQNNALLDRIYQQGVTLEDVAVDRQALDLYLQRMPVGSLKALVRIVEGERAAELVQQGVASADLFKSLLHELRRKGVIRLLAVDPQSLSLSQPLDQLLPDAVSYTQRRRTHWVVVLLACVATVLLAAGGYYLYLRLTAGEAKLVESAAPAPAVASAPTSSPAAKVKLERGPSL